MAEPVQVVFQIDQPGTATAKLKSIDQLFDQIALSAQAAGGKIDKDLALALHGLSAGELTALNQALRMTVVDADKATAALRRLQASSLGQPGQKMAPNLGASLGSVPLSGAGQQRARLDAEFKAFAQSSERTQQINVRNADGMTKLGVQSAKAAQGVNQVRNAMMSLSGIPQAPAIEAVMGLLGLGPVGLLLGGIALGLAAIHKIFTGIREEAEKNLHAVEKWDNLGRMGRRGGTDQAREDFEKLKATRDEMVKLSNLGMTREMAEVSKTMLGVEGLTLKNIESALKSAKARVELFGGDTRDPVMVQKLKDQETLKQKQLQDSNAFNMLQIESANRRMDEAVKLRAFQVSGIAALEKLKQDSFQADFGRAQKLGTLFDEKEKLKAGLGGADLRAKAADVSQQKSDLAKQISDFMLSGMEPERRAALEKFDSLGRTSISDRLAVDASARAIARGQFALGAAGTDKLQQGFALDQIISGTSNIGSLTSDQVDVRMKALEQKTGLDQEMKIAEATKAEKDRITLFKLLEDIRKQLAEGNDRGVEITLKDDSKGALAATIDDMGKTPQFGTTTALTDWGPSR